MRYAMVFVCIAVIMPAGQAIAHGGGLYQVPLTLTHFGDSHFASFLIQCRKLKEVCDGWSDRDARGLYRARFAPFGATMK